MNEMNSSVSPKPNGLFAPVVLARDICAKDGHEIKIAEEGDAEVPSVCEDNCPRCGHEFTREEQEGLRIYSGVYTKVLFDEIIQEP
ncbi:MAG: hypothetical protein Q7R64_03615 [bacterium]|nr:hypothetical protein [bacterium]